MSETYFNDLYEWLQDAYDAAMALAQPMLAMQYAVQMRTMETAGVITKKKETVH